MSNISGIGGGSSMMMAMQSMRRPDPGEMAANLFAQLDTSGQGYLDKAGLQAAFDKISSASSSTGTSDTSSATSNVDALFSELDTNGDGKVTQQEFSDTLKKAGEQLHQQFMSMRMQGDMQGAGGMPPPPPPDGGNDAGFTKDQLTSQLQEIGSTDSKRSSLISSIVDNFDKADTDGDGKVSMKESMAYDKTLNSASGGTSSSSSSSDTSSTGTTTASDLSAELLRQIAQLMQAYGPANAAAMTSSLSVKA